MAANTQPIFALVPETKIVTVTAATTDRTGATTTNLVELLTAGTDGTKITQIGAKVAGTNASVLVLIFITDTAGANPKLFDEFLLNPITPSTTLASARLIIPYSDLQLKSGQKIFVGTTVAITDGVNVFAIKGDY
jgi:hypothetical protein